MLGWGRCCIEQDRFVANDFHYRIASATTSLVYCHRMFLKSLTRQSLQGHRDTYLILFLCLCVVVQMLGVPATLLSPSAPADIPSAVSLEGFSLPQTVSDLHTGRHSIIVVHVPMTQYLPILLTSVFHPPLV